ncbi:MAG: type II toxin-antitoxin system RelE/ParE family toxin [Xanthomonadaceae bacterium]|nr:type II toxin-antitoxin system RelE/ParE family toxin [Xanthomonadaceae bacterium]
MARLNWTEEALRWVGDIFEYIASDNPQAAAQTVKGIYDRAQSLLEHLRSSAAFRNSNPSRSTLFPGPR